MSKRQIAGANFVEQAAYSPVHPVSDIIIESASTTLPRGGVSTDEVAIAAMLVGKFAGKSCHGLVLILAGSLFYVLFRFKKC